MPAVVRTLGAGCTKARPSQGLETLKWLLCSERLFITSVDEIRHASDLPDTDRFLNDLVLCRSPGVSFRYLRTLLTLVRDAECSELVSLVVFVNRLEVADEAELLSRLLKSGLIVWRCPCGFVGVTPVIVSEILRGFS